jgi:isopenicillin N synthase-like dioxygenase
MKPNVTLREETQGGMNERSTLELEDEMARFREKLKLAAEQERTTRERHTRELTPETEAAHEARLEEINRLLEAYHRMAQELGQRTGV